MSKFIPGLHRRALGSAVTMAIAAMVTQAVHAQAQVTDTQDVNQVVVTAQSRSQAMQNVPISMQTMSGAELKDMAASSLSDVDVFVPGLNIDASQEIQPEISIRGVGTADFGIGTDSPVGMYTDGVYAGKTGGSLLNFNDVKQVEVLKGPQGTLFGRNAAAGAISITTNDPSSQYEVSSLVRGGNEGLYHAETLINVPISDDVAFRFSAVDQHTNGWVSNTYNGQMMGNDNDWGTRASLRWQDEDSLAILSWEHEELNVSGPPVFSVTGGQIDFGPPSTWSNPLGEPLSNDASPSVQSRTFNGVTLHIEHTLPFAELTSISAFRHFDSQNWQDNDGSSNPAAYLGTGNVETDTTWQQEFKLNGKTKAMDWVAGVSAFHEAATETENVDVTTTSLDTVLGHAAGVAPYAALTQLVQGVGAATGNPALEGMSFMGLPWQENIQDKGEYKSYAIYGDTIWNLDHDTNLTVGGRYTYDEKSFNWYNPPRTATALDSQMGALNQMNFFPTVVGMGLLPAQTAALLQGVVASNIEFNNPTSSASPFSSAGSWSNFSPRVVLDHHFSTNNMVYASWSEGYQAGGFDAVLTNGRYDPELVQNIEIGTKGQLPGTGLSYSASMFHYKYTNLQSLTLVPASTSTNISSYQVVDSDQQANGVDLDGQWKISRIWRLTGAAEYIDQTYTTYQSPNGTNLNGQPVGTPSLSATTAVNARWPVLEGTGDFNLAYGYTGEQRCNTDTAGQGLCLHSGNVLVGQAMEKIDARLGWSAPSNRWGMALVVDNLTNVQYIKAISTLGSAVGEPYAYLTRPRTIALEFRMKL